MRKFLPLLFILIFGFLKPLQIYAELTPSPTTTTPTTPPSTISPTSATDTATTDINTKFTVDPPQIPTGKSPDYYITDFTPTVTVTFPGLDQTDYRVCLQNDFCLNPSNKWSADESKVIQEISTKGVSKNDIDEDVLKKKALDSNGSIKVCGQDTDGLKTDCKEGRDYFHGGSFYYLTIYVPQGKRYIALRQGGFYVSRGIPKIELTPTEPGKLHTPISFKLVISQDTIRPGGPGHDRNNYEIVLAGPGLDGDGTKNECDWVDKDKKTREFRFPQPDQPGNNHYTDPEQNSKDKDKQKLFDKGYSLPGKYTFKINEQNNEGSDKCSGGFTYAVITCTVTDNPKKPGSCVRKDDPDGKDAKEMLNLLNEISGNAGAPFLPCKEGNPGVKSPLDCTQIDTAIGSISLDPVGFISKLFQIVLSIASIGSFALIIYSGYRLLISRGNKEMIQGARETLTSAILGLLFIIFALVILSVITGNILKLPGFG